MAKMKLLKAYKRNVEVLDANGLPVKDALTGKPLRTTRNIFRYALVNLTPQELALFKRFKRQDGEDYYREEGGYPLHFTSEHFGREAEIEHYITEEGRVGWSVNQTETIELEDMAAKYPALQAMIAEQIMQKKLAGKVLKLNAVNADPEYNKGAEDESAEGKQEPETQGVKGEDEEL